MIPDLPIVTIGYGVTRLDDGAHEIRFTVDYPGMCVGFIDGEWQYSNDGRFMVIQRVEEVIR